MGTDFINCAGKGRIGGEGDEEENLGDREKEEGDGEAYPEV